MSHEVEECPACEGAQVVDDEPCGRCDGEGVVAAEHASLADLIEDAYVDRMQEDRLDRAYWGHE